MVDYAERLKQAMEHAGVSTSELGAGVGISYQAVKKVLDGKSTAFSAKNNAKAAALCRVNPDWLATGEGDMLARSDSARQDSSEVSQVFNDWRLRASPKSLAVIEQLTTAAQLNALTDEDWQLIEELAQRFIRK